MITKKSIEMKMCKENFRFFCCFVMKNVLKVDFKFYQFHNELADIFLNLKDFSREIINCPPRLGKTIMGQLYIAWTLLNDPTSTFVYLSYDQDLAVDKMQDVKEIVKWLASYFEIPELALKKGRNRSTTWHLVGGGYVMAKGTGKPVTGYGCKTAMILDDPNKASDRNSPTLLAKRNANFMGTIRNRIDEPRVPILVIQQRVAAKDLSGFLLEGGSGEVWTHHCKPAIAQDGTPLCPERLPVEEVEKYKSDPFTYNAQYQQVPLDDIGRLFNRQKIVLAQSKPSLVGKKIVLSVDTAAKGDTGNDFHAVSALATDDHDYWILEVENFHADILELMKKIKIMKAKYGNVPVLIEGRGSGNALIQLLNKEINGIIQINPTKDKIERAMVVKYLFDAMNVQFCCSGMVWGEVLAQFSSFPHCQHDDIVDSVVQGLTFLLENGKMLREPSSNTSSSVCLNRRPYHGNNSILGRRQMSNPERGY